MKPYAPLRTFAFPLLGLLLLSCSDQNRSWGDHRKRVPEVSLCALKERPEAFGRKDVQVEGWVYTNLELFGLDDDMCGVELTGPAPRGWVNDDQAKRFNALIASTKNGTLDSHHQVFAVIQGRFETVIELKNGQRVMKGPGFGVTSEPSRIGIGRVVCSVIAPMKSVTKQEALARCKQHVQ